jgi:hypothetical protein
MSFRRSPETRTARHYRLPLPRFSLQRLDRGVICGIDEGLYRQRYISDAASVRIEMTRQIPLSGVIARHLWAPNSKKLREVFSWTFLCRGRVCGGLLSDVAQEAHYLCSHLTASPHIRVKPGHQKRTSLNTGLKTSAF